MNFPQRVVITGIGAVSPAGIGVNPFFKVLERGMSTTGRVSLFTDETIESQVAAEVPHFDLSAFMDETDIKRVPRVVPMAIGAAREAFQSGGIDPNALSVEELRKIGVVIGTGGGGIEFAEKQYEQYYGHQNKKVTPYSVSSSFVGMLSSEISIALGLRGMSHVISTGCTSSTDALGYAYEMIRAGREEMLLSGGAESCITRGIMAGFARMKAVSTRFNNCPEKASKPFDRDRDGFVLAEGAWMFVLESYEHAQKRGAKILAEIVGYASTCEAFHRVAIRNDGVEPARAMSQALSRAGIDPDRVQSIQLHGTATVMNDIVETKAVKLVFGKKAHALPLSAIKSIIGHPQGACGAAGAMAGVFSLLKQFVPPTINYENPDPECDLNYTPNKGIAKDIEYVLCNTIAFGSKNSAIVLKRWGGI